MERVHVIILAVLSVVLAALIALTVHVAAQRPDGYTPPPFEEAAVSGTPEAVPEELHYSTLALREGYVVSLCAAPVLEDGQLQVFFTADADNEFYVRLLVLTEDEKELGATGLLRPGEYVRSVALDRQPKAGEVLIYKIQSFQPETWYSMGVASAQVVLQGLS